MSIHPATRQLIKLTSLAQQVLKLHIMIHAIEMMLLRGIVQVQQMIIDGSLNFFLSLFKKRYSFLIVHESLIWISVFVDFRHIDVVHVL